jgi:hypothetical protein
MAFTVNRMKRGSHDPGTGVVGMAPAVAAASPAGRGKVDGSPPGAPGPAGARLIMSGASSTPAPAAAAAP